MARKFKDFVVRDKPKKRGPRQHGEMVLELNKHKWKLQLQMQVTLQLLKLYTHIHSKRMDQLLDH